MKKVFILLTIIAVFVFTGMAPADVVYEFQGNYSGLPYSPGSPITLSFVYTSPTFISSVLSLESTDLDACTGGEPCDSIVFNPDHVLSDSTQVDRIEIGFFGGAIGGNVYYFEDGAFSAYRTYDTILTAEGTLSVKYATPDSTGVPEPSTMLLLGSGLIGLWGLRRKVRK